MLLITAATFSQNLKDVQDVKTKVLGISPETSTQVDTLTRTELIEQIAIQDSTIKAANDTIAQYKSIPVKPNAGSTPFAWINWVIALIVFIVLWFLSKLKYLSTIQVPLIQRFASETSTFIKKIQAGCLTLSVLIPILIEMGIFTGYWLSILTNIEIAVLAIAGFTLFTTKNARLQK